jgi:uncharacterized membrane protein YeaQ/YmgE (transglycosylase-associated protein family)
MSIIAWIVLGLIAGFIASKLVYKTGDGLLLDIGLGIVGAVLGGSLFSAFGMPGVTGFNVYRPDRGRRRRRGLSGHLPRYPPYRLTDQPTSLLFRADQMIE